MGIGLFARCQTAKVTNQELADAHTNLLTAMNAEDSGNVVADAQTLATKLKEAEAVLKRFGKVGMADDSATIDYQYSDGKSNTFYANDTATFENHVADAQAMRKKLFRCCGLFVCAPTGDTLSNARPVLGGSE